MEDDGSGLPAQVPDGATVESAQLAPAAAAPPAWARGGYDDEPKREFDWRRYVIAIWRRKWMLVIALILGAAGAAVAYRRVEVQYRVQGSLWIEVSEDGGGGLGPIRQAELLESEAWIELLRSFTVLDSVVRSERLYLQVPTDYKDMFESFALADQFLPGTYRLRVSADGRSFTLAHDRQGLVDEGELAAGVGDGVGFEWRPRAGTIPSDTEVRFTVIPPRDAALRLSTRLSTGMDRAGNFITLRLVGTDPEGIASTLNAVMDRHVELAASVKRGKLEETLRILTEQLGSAEQELTSAESQLEVFRVNTITLPTEQSSPIAPGLEQTRDPVWTRYFDMKVQLEQLRRDRERLAEIAREVPGGELRIEALAAIPVTAGSAQLQPLLNELVGARSELRVLRDRYTDDFPGIQEYLTRIRTLEDEAIPGVLNDILDELAVQEQELQARVDSASADLTAIPPRAIEEARLRRQVAIQEALYNTLRQRVETARLATASSIPDVTILDRASVPLLPADDERLRWAGMFFFGCLGAAIVFALVLDRMDPRFRYPTEVADHIGLDILGSIPRIRTDDPKQREGNVAHVVEAFRELRITVGFAHGRAGPLVLVVTSPSQGEGKTLICANLAVAFADLGRRTLLIDGDTRRGDADRLVGAQKEPGLSDHLRGSTQDDIIQSTQYKNLDFIGAGSRGRSTPELIASERFASFLGTLKRAYDVILIDSPPLAAGGDALVLATMSGNVALVIRTGSTEKQLAVTKLDQLSRFPIRVLGAVLNDVPASKAYGYAYGSYLPGYEAGDEPLEVGSGSSGVVGADAEAPFIRLGPS